MNKNILSHRRTLLPFLAKKLKAKTYLEIGVKGGKTFMPIKIRKKYAVDPVFNIKKDYKRQQILRYLFNYFNQYFECTSDEFFDKNANNIFTKNSIDIAFIDGLHTYEQTYKDIVNTLPYVKEDGLIVVHDCSPMSESAAYPANSIQHVKEINPPGFDGLWSGDVWKIIPRLKLSQPELQVFVIDNDSGIGVISRTNNFIKNTGPAKHTIDYTLSDIENWTYADLLQNKTKLLNIIGDEKLLESCKLFS